jgi:hypothetical protein
MTAKCVQSAVCTHGCAQAQKVSRGLPIAPAACEFRLGCRLTDYEWPHVMKAKFQLPFAHFLNDVA